MAIKDALAALEWQESAVSAEEAAAMIPAGSNVFIGGGCAVPISVVTALQGMAVEKPGIRLLHGIALLDEEAPFSPSLRHRATVVGPSDAHLAATGREQYVPILNSEVPNSMFAGRMDVDVAVVQVAPPDALGMCSLGITVLASPAAIERASLVIAEVNEAMPRVKGAALIPITAFDAVVQVEPKLAEYRPPAPGADPEKIARYVARLVDDGSTLHIGLGPIPPKVLEYLGTRRDLGVHTEVITDTVVDLIDAGVVTGRSKSMSRGKVVGSLAMGTAKLYERIADESVFSLRPIEQIASTEAIMKQHRLVSISQAFSADLTGQVCCEAANGTLFGGVGAVPVFHFAAGRSAGGRAILCLPSVDTLGRSSIRPVLDANEGVTVPRYDVRWVATEYGAAYLHSKSLSERAVALIEIAHPDHRPFLLAEAKRLGLVPPDQKMRSRRDYPVEEERTITLRNGTEVLLRPTKTSDAPLLQALFYELDPESVYTRFFRNLSSLTRQAAEHLCSVSYSDEMAFAAVIGDVESGERIVAASSYYVDGDTGLADVGYMVSPEFQGEGLGTALHARTVEYAMHNGVRGFTADVLDTNPAMMHVFARGPGFLESQLSQGVFELELLFEEPPSGDYTTSSIPRIRD
jgi:acyl-CoA hydrolase/GNAT superfamily N-acetyltransferase